MRVSLKDSISKLEIDKNIINKLEEHNINRIGDLWHLNRKKLKDIKLDDREINHITIKMQLSGIDLNHKIY